MYKSLTKESWITYLGLAEGYKVDAMICYGSYAVAKYTHLFFSILDEQNIPYTKEETLSNFIEPITSVLIGGKRIWFTVNYGGSILCEYLHRACLFGSQSNILVGSCGGLSHEVNSCDIIVPSYSYGDESSTRMYNRSGDKKQYSDVNLSKKLIDKLSTGYNTYNKPIITCSAMLGETREDVQQWSAEGYYGVEMEASTIFAVSNHFNVPSAALIYIGDNLIKEELVSDTSYIQGKERRQATQRVLLKTAIEEVIGI